MSELQAHPLLLHAAAATWDDQSEGLAAALKTLSTLDTSLLGQRVSSHADAFVSTWAAEVRRLSRQADEHAQALRDSADFVALADRETTEAMNRLLPFRAGPHAGGAP